MAKDYIPENIGSGFQSQEQINLDREKIAVAIDKQLSRVNPEDNAMEVDLDMGGHSITNIGSLYSASGSEYADKAYVNQEDQYFKAQLETLINNTANELSQDITDLGVLVGNEVAEINNDIDILTDKVNSLEIEGLVLEDYNYTTRGGGYRATFQQIKDAVDVSVLLNPLDVSNATKIHQDNRYKIGDLVLTSPTVGDNNPSLLKSNTQFTEEEYPKLIDRLGYAQGGNILSASNYQELTPREFYKSFFAFIKITDSLFFKIDNIGTNTSQFYLQKSTDGGLTYLTVGGVISVVGGSSLCYDGVDRILVAYGSAIKIFSIQTNDYITPQASLSGLYPHDIHWNDNLQKFFMVGKTSSTSTVLSKSTSDGITVTNNIGYTNLIQNIGTQHLCNSIDGGKGGDCYYNGNYFIIGNYNNAVKVLKIDENDLNNIELLFETTSSFSSSPVSTYYMRSAFSVNKDSGFMAALISISNTVFEFIISEDGGNTFYTKLYPIPFSASITTTGNYYKLLALGGQSFAIFSGVGDLPYISITNNLFTSELLNHKFEGGLGTTPANSSKLHYSQHLVDFTNKKLYVNVRSNGSAFATTEGYLCTFDLDIDNTYKAPDYRHLNTHQVEAYIYAKDKLFDENGNVYYE